MRTHFASTLMGRCWNISFRCLLVTQCCYPLDLLRVGFSSECVSHGQMFVISVTGSGTKKPQTHTHTRTPAVQHQGKCDAAIIGKNEWQGWVLQVSNNRSVPPFGTHFAMEASSASCFIEHRRFLPSARACPPVSFPVRPSAVTQMRT